MENLQRFVEAQGLGGVYDAAVAELRGGRKTSHWMWFVFPQIAGLGRSAMAQQYAVVGLPEARDYLAHPILGPRLVRASQAVLESGAPDAGSLLGGIDAVKLCSSMTLFEAAAGGDEGGAAGGGKAGGDPEQAWSAFSVVLDRYYGGERDAETLRRL